LSLNYEHTIEKVKNIKSHELTSLDLLTLVKRDATAHASSWRVLDMVCELHHDETVLCLLLVYIKKRK